MERGWWGSGTQWLWSSLWREWWRRRATRNSSFYRQWVYTHTRFICVVVILQAVSIYIYRVFCAAYFTGSKYLHKGSLIVLCLFWPLDPKFKLLKCSLKIYNMKVLKLNPNLILNKNINLSLWCPSWIFAYTKYICTAFTHVVWTDFISTSMLLRYL